MSGAKNDPAKRFQELARKLVAVPKRELDQQRVLAKAKKSKEAHS